MTIEVQSTEGLRYLSYQVIGRGDIILSNSIEIPNRKSHIINFLASFAMVPKAQFIVHYIKDSEIVSDRLEIDLGDDLQNFVSFVECKRLHIDIWINFLHFLNRRLSLTYQQEKHVLVERSILL